MGKIPDGLKKFLANKKKGKKGKVVKKGKSVKVVKVSKGKKAVKPVMTPQMGMGSGKKKKPSEKAMAYVKKVGM